jgi:pilus assembly protein CpaC
MMIRFTVRLLAIVALTGVAIATSASVEAAQKITAATGTPITVEVGKGQLIHLDHPVATVFIADPAIADVQVTSSTLLYVFGKAGGETSLIGLGSNDQVVINAPVRARYDIPRIEAAIHEAAPRGEVTLKSINQSLVLDGTVFSAAEGDDIRHVVERFLPDARLLLNNLKVDAPNQINLRVRIAEISRSIIKAFGIRWGAALNRAAAGAAPVLGFATGVTDPIVTPNILNFNNFVGSVDLNAFIDALEQDNLVTILAEPNLTAVSGERASFLAGGQFPVPVPQPGLGGPTITIQFQQFGVSLGFVGTIGANNRINLHVIPEVSEISNANAVSIQGFSVPSLTTRRADTTIDIASGQSFAIAGLLQNDINQTVAKFPWLGDVPVLGALFRSHSFQRNETELVIIVTPYLVRPVATANRLLAPTDGYTPPSDLEFYATGTEYKAQTLKRGAAPVGRSGTGLIGPVGFDLD